MKQPYELLLLTDAAVTRRSASVGGHQTLRFVPGQCVLGAAAARTYASLAGRDLAWKVFHGGDVRFGDALPLVGEAPGWPAPLSLHVPKGQAGDDGRKVNQATVNLLCRDRGDLSWEQLRETFVALDGSATRPAPRRSMRTAVGATGRARDGYLFELEAIPAGTRLRGVIEGDEALVREVVEALHDTEIRVGRSRSAEFGRARFRRLDDALPAPITAPHHEASQLSFWCVSDLALRAAQTGQPTLTPEPAAFGLPEGWTYDPARSFVRTRRYTPFNGHRRAYDLERQVIVAGSVLSFRGPAGLAPEAWDAVAARVAGGVGEHRAEGLGAVVFEPALLSGEHPVWEPATAAIEPPLKVAATLPDDPLARWLAAEEVFHAVEAQAWEAVRSMIVTMRDARRAWAMVPDAQWGALRALARRHRASPGRLAEELARHVGAVEEKGQDPKKPSPRGARARLWSAWRDGVQPAAAITAWYEKRVKAEPAAAAPLALELLCTHYVRDRRRAGSPTVEVLS